MSRYLLKIKKKTFTGKCCGPHVTYLLYNVMLFLTCLDQCPAAFDSRRRKNSHKLYDNDGIINP